MSPHLAFSLGVMTSILQLTAPMTSVAGAQGFHRMSTAASSYQVVVLYDRLTDSTRVTASFIASSRRFGLDSRAWLDLSFSFGGAQLTTAPGIVVLTIEAWTPSRGGWAFAHRQQLRVRSGDTLLLETAAAGYRKHPVQVFDPGRRDGLWFEIPVAQFAKLAASQTLVFEAGNARFRVGAQRMEMLRELVRRMTPSERGPK